MTRRGKIAIGLLTAATIGAGLWIRAAIESGMLRERIRAKVIAEVEKAPGGKPEMESFDYDWRTQRADVKGFVLHGTEPPGADPLFAAEHVEARLNVLSFLHPDARLDTLIIDKPRIHLMRHADGGTNIPEPKIPRKKSGKNVIEDLLDLAVNRVEINDGVFTYEQEKKPFHLRAERVELKLGYEPEGKRYRGDLSSPKLTTSLLPIETAVRAAIAIERDRIQIEKLHLTSGRSSVEAKGVIETPLDPKTTLDFTSRAALEEFGSWGRGLVTASGRFKAYKDEVSAAGKLSGGGLNFTLTGAGPEPIRLSAVSAQSDFAVSLNHAEVTNLRLASADGEFRGSASLRDWSQLSVKGHVTDIALERLEMPWSGLVSGPVELAGTIAAKRLGGVKASAQLSIVPVSTGVPLEGFIDATFDQATGAAVLGESYLSLPKTNVEASGKIGATLKVVATTQDLSEIFPLIERLSPGGAAALPVSLASNGVARFEGTVGGDLADPSIDGRLTASNILYGKDPIDRFSASFHLDKTNLRAVDFSAERGVMRADGSGAIGLTAWKLAADAPLKLTANLREVSLKDYAQGLPLAGAASGSVSIEGSLDKPRAAIKAQLDNLTLYGEKLDRVRAEMTYADRMLELRKGEADFAGSHLSVTGSYRHPGADWNQGDIAFAVNGAGITFEQWSALRAYSPLIEGRLETQTSGAGKWDGKEFLHTGLAGKFHVSNVSMEGKKLGGADFTASTSNGVLTLDGAAAVAGSNLKFGGQWSLRPGYPGTGRVEIAQVSFDTLRAMQPGGAGGEKWPFSGFVAGAVEFTGPAFSPDQWKGEARIPTLEIKPDQRVRQARQPRDELVLRNAGPILLGVDGKSLVVRQAHLTGKDTDVSAQGSLSFLDKSPWDLRIKGSVNLAIARNFNPDIISAGTAVMDAQIRGALNDPQAFGRLDLKDASLSVEDVPNGLEKVNGTVLFVNKRAMIENQLVAQTGGGILKLSGFVELAPDTVRYRLVATADHVRLRYPEGVSTVANFALTLDGSSSQSLLGGTISIVRAGFTPRTDIGSLLTQSSKAVSAPVVTNEFLRGMTFDVRIQTAPNVEFSTSLTRDLQIDADLRLRGSPLRPVVMGHATVNQGEINFFGGKYTISRGEITFANPSRLEPVVDLDLQTRVRGIEVNINFAGPVSKMNGSYRSDPPMQTAEILALLTVGRSPDAGAQASSGIAGSQTLQRQGGLIESGANTLLGQAIAAPVSDRLQRFFGVSRLKIDPQLTGFDGTPQARLTLEQQVSRDITLTFVTNLTKTQQQIVNVEWNVNRQWSLVAVRDENGVFGVDVLYKKRYK